MLPNFLLALALLGCTEDPVDADGDGVLETTDCDDADASVFPGAPEACDGRDENCNSLVDEEATDAALWYYDADGDGHGAERLTLRACAAPPGYVASADDCDDLNAAAFPSADEPCDQPLDLNCDGSSGFADADADGVPACEDCDDADATAFPGGVERCDGADNDCDGTPDNGALDAATWYTDADRDGFGDPSTAARTCDAPASAVARADDCDDADASAFPGAPERCDAGDQNCDGDDDLGALDAALWFLDQDSDGFGDRAHRALACAAPAQHVADDLDCDDADAATHPGVPEVCDGADNDCDRLTDEPAVDNTRYYLDADGDGFGSDRLYAEACEAPPGYLPEGGDCDDLDATLHPETAWLRDQDGDGFGDRAHTLAQCAAPLGYTRAEGDCDDADAALHPNTAWALDEDGDGFAGDRLLTQCARPPEAALDTGDCDDADADTYPGAFDRCDGLDNDCDGAVDPPAVAWDSWNPSFFPEVATGVGSVGVEMDPGYAQVQGGPESAIWFNQPLDAERWDWWGRLYHGTLVIYTGETPLPSDNLPTTCSGLDALCLERMQDPITGDYLIRLFDGLHPEVTLAAKPGYFQSSSLHYADGVLTVYQLYAPEPLRFEVPAAHQPRTETVRLGLLAGNDADGNHAYLTYLGCPLDGDLDADGFSRPTDLYDGDRFTYPGAPDHFGLRVEGDHYAQTTDTNGDGADGVDADGDGLGSAESGGEDCDDTDASVTFGAGCGLAHTCAEVHAAWPDAPTGLYHLDADGVATLSYCEMQTDGGGWTLALHLASYAEWASELWTSEEGYQLDAWTSSPHDFMYYDLSFPNARQLPARELMIQRRDNDNSVAWRSWPLLEPDTSLHTLLTTRHREVVTGPARAQSLPSARPLDAIFAFTGPLVFNTTFGTTGVRIAVDGQDYPEADSDRLDFYGLGVNYALESDDLFGEADPNYGGSYNYPGYPGSCSHWWGACASNNPESAPYYYTAIFVR